MKMKKSFALLMACGLSLSLIACTGEKGTSGEKGKEAVEEEYRNDIYYTSSFFIKNADGKYALFNNKGKQLTDFEFTGYEKFRNGYALVRKDGKYGVLSEKGKLTVNFDKYLKIQAEGGFFKVCADEHYVHYDLINGEGEKLCSLDDYSHGSSVDENYMRIVENDTKKVTYYNYRGTKMAVFTQVGDISEISDRGIFIATNNGSSYIYNIQSGKEIIKIDTGDNGCSLSNVSEDESRVLLKSGDSYIYVNDGKRVEGVDNEVGFYGDITVSYNEDGTMTVLDNENYDETTDISYSTFADNGTYVGNAEDGIRFCKNGKVIKEIGGRTIEYTNHSTNGLFIAETYFSKEYGTESGVFELYNSEGEKITDTPFSMITTEVFDKNDLVTATLDKQYYLVNTKGEQISAGYDKIAICYGSFYPTKKDKLNGVINAEGKEMIPCEYEKVSIHKINGNYYAKCKAEDGKMMVFDLTNNKELINSNGEVTLYTNYIYEEIEGKGRYYTFDMDKFYEK